MKMLLIMAPGQGAQSAGFLVPWLELPGAAERLSRWSELVGMDLIRMGTAASDVEIVDTAVAQPLLTAAALLTAGYLGMPDAVAGHSVGELTAAAIAGVLSPEDALRLAGVRGRAMAEASSIAPTGMTVVLGGDENAVREALREHGLTMANVNAKGQIVAGGTLAQLAALAASPPLGARLRPLRVAGAFHTAHMAPAREALAAAASGTMLKQPEIVLLSNRDGSIVASATDWLRRIVGQVSTPVRWDLCMETMSRLRVSALLELTPAGTLTGLAKRALPGVPTLAVKTPDQLDAARLLLAEAAGVRVGATDADPDDVNRE
jgi:[acyl-carrier-protein] S-malonyltransferase